jgi:seryl-tRNA synthetase
MERCEAHDELIKSIGRMTSASEEHSRQLGKLFSKLEDLKECVDQNEVRADLRDKKLDEINHKIENGLRTTVEETKKRIEQVFACIERRKIERENEHKRGFNAYFIRGWVSFKERSAYIIVTAGIVGGVWALLFMFAKIKVFHEAPTYLLKLFGVG